MKVTRDEAYGPLILCSCGWNGRLKETKDGACPKCGFSDDFLVPSEGDENPYLSERIKESETDD